MPYYSCPFAQQYGSMNYPTAAQGYSGYPMEPFTPILSPYQLPTGMYAPQGMELPEETDMETAGQITRDPPPVLSNNPATASIALFKELTGYPNYGNPSGNADILYTGNRGTWTFDIPAFLFVPGNLRGQIVLRAVLDDHADVAVNRYSARITINGNQVHDGRVALVHGTPSGGRFNNWRSLTFNIPNIRRNNRVVIVNTSTVLVKTCKNVCFSDGSVYCRALPLFYPVFFCNG